MGAFGQRARKDRHVCCLNLLAVLSGGDFRGGFKGDFKGDFNN